MKYISPELISKAKETDLLTYLRIFEPNELVRVSGNVYCTRTHDSLKISNGKWMWWSRGIGGRSAVDYLVKVEGMSFPDAVRRVLETEGMRSITDTDVSFHLPKKQFVLPSTAPNNDRAIQYLKSRGIPENIINYCIGKGLLYESDVHHNVVFVGYDDDHVPKYAALRGTGDRVFKGEVSGSDKRYSFKLTNRGSGTVHLFEGAVDLLSYAAILQSKRKDWTEDNFLSLSGIYGTKQTLNTTPASLDLYLDHNPQMKTIYLHLDNDTAGKRASKALMEMLSGEFTVFDRPVPLGKDVNDYLKFVIDEQNRKGEFERENRQTLRRVCPTY